MSPFAKFLFIVGSFLILVGSLLPWRRDGDFVSYWTHGIQIYPSVKDNGGFLVVLLTVIIIILMFWSPQFLEGTNWKLILAVILVMDISFQIGKLLLDRRSAHGLVGAPAIQIGLIMVLVGSLLLLVSVAIHYSKPQLQN